MNLMHIKSEKNSIEFTFSSLILHTPLLSGLWDMPRNTYASVTLYHLKHSDGKDKKRFACPDCDYTCALKQCLTSHLRGVHNKGRPLVPCPYEGCAVKRLSKSAIQLHVDSVHLKLKRHFCHLCDYKSCDGNRWDRDCDFVLNSPQIVPSNL